MFREESSKKNGLDNFRQEERDAQVHLGIGKIILDFFVFDIFKAFSSWSDSE